jgi:hypothetical protein
MSSHSSRARAAGRRIASGAAQTGFAMAGGGVYYGAHALITPSLYGTDASNIPKRCWMVPVLGVIAGHLLTKAPKIGSMGLGLAGGATAIGIEQIQMGVSIKKNAAASGTSGFDAGALLGAGSPRQLAGGVGEVTDADAGVLWEGPNYGNSLRHEAAGLTI